MRTALAHVVPARDGALKMAGVAAATATATARSQDRGKDTHTARRKTAPGGSVGARPRWRWRRPSGDTSVEFVAAAASVAVKTC